MNEATDEQDTAGKKPNPEPTADPVRRWTFILLAAALGLFVWHIAADRITPYTSQARVHALIVPIAAEVSGTVTEVRVSNNQPVVAGQILFQIEPNRYQLAAEAARADLQTARQSTGASTAGVDAARAAVASAEASLFRARQDAVRLRRIKNEDPGAISDRRVESAEAALRVAQSQLRSAEANLEKARQDLGAEGENNARVLQAQAALERAELDLQRTQVAAPGDGVVTDVRVDKGNFASAGAPQMTFVAAHNVWVQAAFSENNLGNAKPGDSVEIGFDALPGRVFAGQIREIGFGVAVDSAPLGGLPTIENDRQWLRDEQRFATVIDFEMPDPEDRNHLRVGSQASVIVYTGDNWLFNAIGRLYVRAASLLGYVY